MGLFGAFFFLFHLQLDGYLGIHLEILKYSWLGQWQTPLDEDGIIVSANEKGFHELPFIIIYLFS